MEPAPTTRAETPADTSTTPTTRAETPTTPTTPTTFKSAFNFGTTPTSPNPCVPHVAPAPAPFSFGVPPPAGNLFATPSFCFRDNAHPAFPNNGDAVFYSILCAGESGHHRRVQAPSVIAKLRRQYSAFEDDGLQFEPYKNSALEEAEMALQQQKQLLKLQQLICDLHEAVVFLHTPSLTVTPDVDEDKRRVRDMLVRTKKERNRIIERWCTPTMHVNLLDSL